jgi:D-beta-D-heptose 7-phosphate kinase/D-beta-D-heptose 1-phosphate adenosyltransferase
MANSHLLAALDKLSHPRILVLGDLILDRYTWGNAERVSQEAPVILLRADHREARLGGAANVCNMLRGLEAEVCCAGVIGADPDGATVRHLLSDAGVDHSLVLRDDKRPTTVKERFIGRAANRHPHQILRVDREVRDLLSEELEAKLAGQAVARLNEFDVLLVSDYGKGVCSPSLLAEMISAARQRRIPVIVDPSRDAQYARYRGATAVTPNRFEAEQATGLKIAVPQDALPAGHQLCRQLDLEVAIITLDSDGMFLAYPDGTGEHFPTRPRKVYDITGAGDMVLSMIGLCMACGISREDTVRLANIAGGLEVEQVGVVPIARQEIRLDILRSGKEGAAGKIITAQEAAQLAQAAKSKAQKVVFTNGCFDLLHEGHVTYLEEAARQGDLLILGLNSDFSVRQIKGPTRPVRKQADRAAVLAALAYVDYVVIFDDPTPIKLIDALRPDVLVKGGDYQGKEHEVTGRELVESYGGRLHLAAFVEGVSTTQILRTIAA